MRERYEVIHHTCERCGITDATVLDLDTGSACHPELRDCIAELRWLVGSMEDEIVRLRSQLAAAKADAENILAGRRAEADALHQRLTTAERERDEARREREVVASERDRALQEAAEAEAECDTLRHRAERAERVVEAAKMAFARLRQESLPANRFESFVQISDIDAVQTALDAAEGGA